MYFSSKVIGYVAKILSDGVSRSDGSGRDVSELGKVVGPSGVVLEICEKREHVSDFRDVIVS